MVYGAGISFLDYWSGPFHENAFHQEARNLFKNVMRVAVRRWRQIETRKTQSDQDKALSETRPRVDSLNEKEKKEAFDLGERYKRFLTDSKTEREAVKEIVSFAESRGFKALDKPGRHRKVYAVYKRKMVALAILGKEPPQKGASHHIRPCDCPRWTSNRILL